MMQQQRNTSREGCFMTPAHIKVLLNDINTYLDTKALDAAVPSTDVLQHILSLGWNCLDRDGFAEWLTSKSAQLRRPIC